MENSRNPRSVLLFSGLLVATLAASCASDARDDSTLTESGPRTVIQRADFDHQLLLTGQLEAVRSIEIKSPQTSMFQMRIQFMAEEGTIVEKGEPLLDFDNSSLADTVRDLESRILDAETQIVSKRAELASALKDLEIEIAEREFDVGWTGVEAAIDPDVLSEKDYSDRQLAFSKAQQELAETRERIELTRDRGQAQLDVLEINRDKLQKDHLSAEQDLELLSIKAPARGLVIYKRRHRTTMRYQEGDSCWPGQGVVRLPDLSAMQVAFDVNEVDAPLLEKAMRLAVTLDAFPGRELTAEIRHIPSMAVKRDEESKVAVFKVVASLSETWPEEMKPGMSALGTLVASRRRNAPVVSRSDVHFDGVDYWLTVGEDSPPERIQPLARNARFYVISEEEYARLRPEEHGDEPLTAASGSSG